MALLKDIVKYCDDRVNRREVNDFAGSENGLQVANNGTVLKIGAAVDAGLVPFQKSVEAGIDFLICHHGLFWSPISPVTRNNYGKLKVLFDGNCALYGSHLPLDCHPEIGNNAILASKLHLSKIGTFLPFEGHDIGLILECNSSRDELKAQLNALFPKNVVSIEFGSRMPRRIGILTGSGASAVTALRAHSIDTLITGEIKQNFFNYAQEENLNLYMCGHYETEVFGVEALGQDVAAKYGLSYEFIRTDCPL